MARELIERMLHLAGFSTLPAPTGERALVQLREHRREVDWLVASVSLPGLVDAAILSDEFRTIHPNRAPLVLAAPERAAAAAMAGSVPAGDVVPHLQALVRDHGAELPRGEEHSIGAMAA
jgi:hypothetical protein